MLAPGPSRGRGVGAGAAPGVRFGPGDVGDLRGFGVDLVVPFAGPRPAGRPATSPLAHAAGGLAARRGRVRGHPASASGPADLAARWSATCPGPVGVLAMGDGSARRTVKAPGLPRRRRRAVRRRRRRGPGRRRRRRAGRARPGRGRAAAGRRGRRPGGPSARRWPAGTIAAAAAPGRRAVRRRLPRRRLGRRVTAAPPGGRRRRADRHRQDRAGRRARPAARRRGGQRRLDAALPRHGHRHRQARRRRARRACRTTCSTSGTCREPASVAEYRRRWRGPRSTGCGRPASSRCWSAGPGCTCGPCSTSWTSPAPTPTSGRGWRPSWPTSARRRCTPGWPTLDPAAAAGDPAQQRTADRARAGGRRADRAARSARTLPEPRPHYPAVVVGLDRDPAELDERIAAAGGPDVGGRASSTRWRRWPPTGCARGRRPPARSATRRCWRSSTATLTAEEARERTVGATRRFVRRQRSWFRRDPALTWFDAARPDLVDAVARVIADRTIEP